MKTEFKPGPWAVETWSYDKANPPRTEPTIVGGTDAIAAILPLWEPDKRENERAANARLIAAAPDIYAALEGCVSALRKTLPFLPPDKEAVFCGEWLDVARAAIAAIAKVRETKP